MMTKKTITQVCRTSPLGPAAIVCLRVRNKGQRDTLVPVMELFLMQTNYISLSGYFVVAANRLQVINLFQSTLEVTL